MIGMGQTDLGGLSVNHDVQVDTLTGRLRLSVPVLVTPGRESFSPNLNLVCANGSGNSTFGLGWVLSGVPSIGIDAERRLPAYDSREDRFVYAGAQELVPACREHAGKWSAIVDLRGNYEIRRYRVKQERSFERFERWVDRTTLESHWRTIARNGVVSVFGLVSDGTSRINDPTDSRRVFQWLLEAQYDPKGNAILYEYAAEDGANVDTTTSFEASRRGVGQAQRYIKRIRYGNSRPLSPSKPDDTANIWHIEVLFDYGEHGTIESPTYATIRSWPARSDAFSSGRPGFDIRTHRLCRQILNFHRFSELGSDPCLTGATILHHRGDPSGAVLDSIEYRGYHKDLASGTYASRSLPPLGLSYSTTSVASAFEKAEAANNLPAGVDGSVPVDRSERRGTSRSTSSQGRWLVLQGEPRRRAVR